MGFQFLMFAQDHEHGFGRIEERPLFDPVEQPQGQRWRQIGFKVHPGLGGLAAELPGLFDGMGLVGGIGPIGCRAAARGRSAATTRTARPVSSAERRVADVLERLWAEPVTHPSLDTLAAQSGMSRRSLTRHIRARTGGTLGGWMRRARVARAQEALLQGPQGVEWVVALSGFPDAQSLRKAFRRELGMTPMQWLSRQRLG